MPSHGSSEIYALISSKAISSIPFSAAMLLSAFIAPIPLFSEISFTFIQTKGNVVKQLVYPIYGMASRHIAAIYVEPLCFATFP